VAPDPDAFPALVDATGDLLRQLRKLSPFRELRQFTPSCFLQ
jgi:hypothetical protein